MAQDKPIAIIIPTINPERAKLTGKLAMITAMTDCRLIISDDPRRTRFSKTINRGLRQLEPGEDAMLLNDDVDVFHHGWLATLQRALYSRPKLGLVAPSGRSATAPMRAGYLGDNGLEIAGQAPFWCVLIRRVTLNDCGLLDERCKHYGSDNLYCYWMNKRGWKIGWVKDIWLGHRKHASGRLTELRKTDVLAFRRLQKRIDAGKYKGFGRG